MNLPTAVRSCRFCPMCHHADLTVTLERRETYSARSRGLILFSAEQGITEWSSEVSDVMYRFFADGLCGHVCAGHIPHDEMIIDARSQLVVAGQAPPEVAQVRESIERTGNPWAQAEPDLFSLTGAATQSQVLVYFGPTARIHRQSSVRALAAVLKAAGVGFSVLEEEGDTGLLLYQLGETQAAMRAAKGLSAKIAMSGARTIVTPDADAYRALTAGFGSVPHLSGPTVWHTSEFLIDLVSGLKLSRQVRSRVAYHDPCALARFAPCMDAPRELVRNVCGEAPLEIGTWSRQLAVCSGECGGVPFTHPRLAGQAAELRLREAREVSADLIVAGSPAAAASLEGRGMKVRDLSEFLAESMG